MTTNREKIIATAVRKAIRKFPLREAPKKLWASILEAAPDITMEEIEEAFERIKEDATIAEMLQRSVRQGDKNMTSRELVKRAAAEGDAEAITLLKVGFLDRPVYG